MDWKNEYVKKEKSMAKKIAIIGAGATGSVFAGYLRKGGAEDITLVDIYQAHMDAVAKNGLIFTEIRNGVSNTTVLPGFKTAYDPGDIGKMDIAIFITKATQLRTAVEGARNCFGPDTVAVSLINGIGNDDVLREFFAEDHIMIGSGVVGTELPEPGHCIAKPCDGVNMNFGALKNGALTDEVGTYLESCFRKGGLNPDFQENIMPVIWKKVITNCTVCGCCSVTGLKEGPIEDDPFGAQLYRNVIRECCAVATALGYPFDADDYIEHQHKTVITGNYDYYPSMAQDMLIYHRQTEIGAMNGKISELGKRLGVPTPTNDTIALIVQCVQNNYDKVRDF